MELQALANLGEFIGGIGVVISLIYVAFQVKSNTRSQRNDITARTLERLSSMQREMVTNIELNKLVVVALRDVYALEQLDRIRFAWWFTEFFSAMEFLYDQHRQGNVDPDMWERWRTTLRWWLTYRGTLEWWRCVPTPFTKSFSQLVTTLIEEGCEYPDRAAWAHYVNAPQSKPA